MKKTSGWLFWATVIVWLHVVVSVLHGVAHVGEEAWLSPAGDIFVALVIGLAPLLALWLLNIQRLKLGAWLLALSMAGSLIFGIIMHFVLPGTDNVAFQAPGAWHVLFLLTSILLVPIEAAGTGIGVWGGFYGTISPSLIGRR